MRLSGVITNDKVTLIEDEHKLRKEWAGRQNAYNPYVTGTAEINNKNEHKKKHESCLLHFPHVWRR